MASLRNNLIACLALQGGLLGWIAYEGAAHLEQAEQSAATTKALVEARSEALVVVNGISQLRSGEAREPQIETALRAFGEQLQRGGPSGNTAQSGLQLDQHARSLLPTRVQIADAQQCVLDLQAPLLARVQKLETEALAEENEDAAFVLTQVRRDVGRVQGAVFRYAATAGTDSGEQAKLLIQLSLEAIDGNLAALHTESDEVEVDPFEDAKLREIAVATGSIASELEVAVDKFLVRLDGQVAALATFRESATALVAALQQEQAAAEAAATAEAAAAMRSQNTALVVSAALMVLMALTLMMQVVRPIVRMAAMLRSVGNGECDLSQRLKVTSRDEIGQFAEGFNTFVEAIHGTVATVGENVEELNRTVEQLDEVATSLNEQAAASERHARDLAAAGESIGSAVGSASAATCDLAASSTQVHDGSREANRQAAVVAETVARVDAVVHQLADRGGDIERIATVISDLAGQTNLLALNAAIEAARAGEAGAGFAVVAEEVRSLARLTSEQAADIGETVTKVREDSTSAVGAMVEVTELVDSVRRHQHEICRVVEGLDTTSVTVRGLVKTAAQDSATIDTVCPAVDASTKRTRELAGDTTTMTTTLRDAAERLGRQVQRFRV